jgi:alpha-tubulin suppressor-like RCC1 family protein
VELSGAITADDDDDVITVSGAIGGHSFGLGEAHTCAATVLSDVWCWGDNSSGQLGVGTTTDSALPVRASAVGGLKGAFTIAVAAGRAHSCALTLDLEDEGSDVFCWGDNSSGQLGDSSLTSRSRPAQVATDVLQVVAGEDHTCVLTLDLTVSCWGRNDVGQLGGGTVSAAEPTPQEVPGLSDIVDIAAADNNTCAVDDDGDAWCWGSDTHGQLGNGGGSSGTPESSPVQVTTTGVTGGFVQIEVGDRHVCALGSTAAVYCWGDDAAGQLGNGASAADPSRPSVVTAGGRRFIAVAAGGDSSCAIDANLAGYCWGDNSSGQLGVGDTTDRSTPAAVDQSDIRVSTIASIVVGYDRPMVIDLDIGRDHACAVDLESGIYCWGANAAGQLGDGTTEDATTPVATALQPSPVTGVVAASRNHALRASWSTPADPGVAPVRGYSVLAFENTGSEALFDAQVCGTTSALSCTLSDLTNNHKYTVLVAAVTQGGVSYGGPVYGVPRDASGGGGGLPITGSGVTQHVSLAGLLFGVGVLLLAAGRRRVR